ncbi:unnamed protein product [Pieris brassicae]|uniref:SAP domain-containing protein n=1 Tax=Pieris brassicae TaxID=7116 RepID=A0A9P0TNC7_PIEBR|nr:unnamed protein product [Pieris brassicae]
MYSLWNVSQLKAELKIRGATLKGRKADLVKRQWNHCPCKHVATVLYGIEHMVCEKIIIRHQVPTEKLQKFHVPKKNTEEYNKRFRSLVTNYPSSSRPLKQLYEPANPHAIEWDHSYSKEGTEEKLLRMLNLLSISPAQVAAIEIETRGQAQNNMWSKHCEVRITASKFHTICHLRSSNQERYACQFLSQQKFTSRSRNHGIINEKVALQQYMEETNLQVFECRFFISSECPYLGASPDGILGDETIIEVKCPYSSRLDSPLCRGCFSAEESVTHVVLECEAVTKQRVEILGTVRSLRDAARCPGDFCASGRS